jgi:hypothetical protein
MRRPILFSLLVVPVLAAGLVIPACSDESEGQPCDPRASNSGNDDCQSSLICTQVAAGFRCCPQDRTQATTPECALPPTGLGDASPAPPDVKTMETSSQDSTGEAQGEAAADSPVSSDAPSESAADGGGDAAKD